MRSRAVRVGLVLLVCSTVAVAIGATVGNSNGQSFLAQEQPEPDNTVTRIDLTADGAAVWTIRFRTQLETDDDVAEYQRFQESFAENESRYLDPFEERMTGVVTTANVQHDRDMRARNFTARTSVQEVPRRWGIVTFQFRWDGIAASDGDRLIVGDIFGGGFYIGDDDVLEIAVPEGYAITSTDPSPDEIVDGVVQWNGREDFPDSRPRVIVQPTGEATSDTGTTGNDTTDRSVGTVLLVVGIVLIIGIGTGVAVSRGEWNPIEAIGTDVPSRATETETDTPPTESTEDGDPDEERSTNSTYEIVTNEDNVRDVLQKHNGQMKQSDIADALGWSKSKTSRVLSEMTQEGTIEKLRLGRENVIRLNETE